MLGIRDMYNKSTNKVKLKRLSGTITIIIGTEQ